MASDREVQYHRTFLSPDYYTNFTIPPFLLDIKLRDWEIRSLKSEDPELFEKTRQALASYSKTGYVPGLVPPDELVGKVLKPQRDWQGVIRSPSGAIAMPMPYFQFKAYRLLGEKAFYRTTMYQKTDQNFEKYAIALGTAV